LHKRQVAKQIIKSKADTAASVLHKRHVAKQIKKSKADTTHKKSVQPVSCAKGKRQNKLQNQRLTPRLGNSASKELAKQN